MAWALPHLLGLGNLPLGTQRDLSMVMEGDARSCKVVLLLSQDLGQASLNHQPYCVPKTLISLTENTCQVDQLLCCCLDHPCLVLL